MAVEDCTRSAQHVGTAPPVHGRAIEPKNIFVHASSREADRRGRFNLSKCRCFVTSAEKKLGRTPGETKKETDA